MKKLKYKNKLRACTLRALFFKSNKLKRAFSFIEIMVIVGLIAFMFAFLVPQLTGPSAAEKSNHLSQIQTDIRSAYDMAVLNNKYYRIVFNMLDGEYWLEVSDAEEVYLGNAISDRDPTAEEETAVVESFDSDFEVYESLALEPIKHPDPDRDDEEISIESPVIKAKTSLKNLVAPQWKQVEDIEWTKRQIGPALLFRGMQAEHHSEYQGLEDIGAEARGILYFFPAGYVEHAVIHIAHRKDDEVDPNRSMYTILTKAYAGYATIESGMIEVNLEQKILGED